MPVKPSPPVEVQPAPKWAHYGLYQRVRDAVTALPLHFKTETVIAGIMATDLFTLAAEYRNYHWQHLRDAKTDATIISPHNVTPYPQKSDAISDKAKSDDGKNFGRFSRTGLVDDYLKEVAQQPICGIEAAHWRAFFKAFQEQATPKSVHMAIGRFLADLKKDMRAADPTVLAGVEKILNELKGLVSG